MPDAELRRAVALYGFGEYLDPRSVAELRNSHEALRKKYKAQMLRHHPDKGGDSEKFLECHEAYETLFKYFQLQETVYHPCV